MGGIIAPVLWPSFKPLCIALVPNFILQYFEQMYQIFALEISKRKVFFMRTIHCFSIRIITAKNSFNPYWEYNGSNNQIRVITYQSPY